jgi:hypothetical protein
VRVSDRQIKFVLSAETTQNFSGASVIFDYIECDHGPCGWIDHRVARNRIEGAP